MSTYTTVQSPTDPKKVLNHKTIYTSFLDGQLTVGKSRVDNFSQGESFFSAVNNTIMFDSTRKPKYYPKEKISKKHLLGSPLLNRDSMVSVKNLPKPPTPVRKIIEADVYKEHDDSSDDDLHADRDFRTTSFGITQRVIDDMTDDRIAELNKQILLNKYNQGLKDWRAHRLLPRELYEKLSQEPQIQASRSALPKAPPGESCRQSVQLAGAGSVTN